MERRSIIESFMDHDDAYTFFDKHLLEHVADGWSLVESSGIQFINHQFRVGLIFEKPLEK